MAAVCPLFLRLAAAHRGNPPSAPLRSAPRAALADPGSRRPSGGGGKRDRM